MLVVLLTLLGCGRSEMGGTCSSSEQCADGGSCLKGVCSGYACTIDADCAEDHVCGEISGMSVCALLCEAAGDDSCPGQMSCQAFEGSDTGAAALYCL